MSEYGEELSDRELDVLRCVARGATNKETAAELSISENTVKVHLRRVYAKLGVSSRTEATHVGIEQGIIIIPGLEPESLPDTPELTAEPDVADVANDETAVSEPTPEVVEATPEAIVQPAPRRSTAWRTASLVLLILLVVIVAGFISLRLASEDILPTPEPFATTTFGEDWAATNRPLPVAQTDAAAAAAGVIVYAIGGETAAGVTNTLYAFNATEHTWRSLTPKPTALAAASATALFGEIYVVGGRLADGQPTNVVEVYSPTQNAWRPVTALPQPIAGGLALSDGSFLYLFGGWNGSDYLDDTYVYDPGEDSWRPLASMGQPRAFATGQFMIGRLYVVGGYDGTEELALCQFLDPNSMQWDDCPDMLLPRGGAGSAAVLNKLYVIGGGKNGNQTINFNERYDPATETWQVVNTPLLDDTPSWVGLGVANVENRIFAFGGQQGDTLIADTYIYSPFIYRTFLPSVPVDNN